MSDNLAAISEVVSLLKKDAQAPYPKYPPQAVYAVQNENVAKSLSRRLDQGAKLSGIRSLAYD